MFFFLPLENPPFRLVCLCLHQSVEVDNFPSQKGVHQRVRKLIQQNPFSDLLLLFFSGELIAFLFFFSILFLEELQVSQLCFFIFNPCLLSLLLSEHVLHGVRCLQLLLGWHD